MGTEPIVESGLQVISRLIDRPSVEDLDMDLFFNKLQNTDVIEVKGTISSGITALLTKLIAKCILPSQYNGLDTEVLFINTENQLKVSHLFTILRSEICDINGPINVDKLVREVLNNLKIINCYNHHQFFLTLNSLDNILLKNRKVGFIVIDSISAFYWQQRDDLSYNSFFMKIMNIIKKVTINFKVVAIYTKQLKFESKKQTNEWHEGKKILRYEISLYRNEHSNQLTCNVKSGKDKKQLHYKMNETALTWIQQENKNIII